MLVLLHYKSCDSHQGSRVELKNDMLQEGQQVGRPILQLLNIVEVRMHVIHGLKDKGPHKQSSETSGICTTNMKNNAER